MTSPAMGTITFSDNVRIMLNMPAFHLRGLPYLGGDSADFSFTSPNIVDQVPVNGSYEDFLYPFRDRVKYALHKRLPVAD